MGRLVEDLLTLARSDGPDFVVLVGRFERASPSACSPALIARRPRLARTRSVPGSSVPTSSACSRPCSSSPRTPWPTPNPATSSDWQAISGDSVDLWVHDSGPGIAPEERARVLERFVRAGTSRADGAGLGLAIVAGIARAHHGEVVIDDTVAGARVRLHLPVRGWIPGHAS